MGKAILSALVSAVKSVLEPVMRNRVYVVRSGLTSGLKRRGGLGFVPKKSMTREHVFLQSLDLEGKTVYDVGGFIGLITMFFARKVKGGQVVTFEPNPQNYDAILDHIELNGFTNVQVIPMGLGSKRDTLKFVMTDHLPARGTADPNRQTLFLDQKDTRVFQIEVDTLDNQVAVNDLPQPDFIKIDVEGLEIDVLRGMPQVINRYKPEMLIELHGTSERKIVEFLLSHDYSVYQVEDGLDITQQNIDMVHGHLYASPSAHASHPQ